MQFYTNCLKLGVKTEKGGSRWSNTHIETIDLHLTIINNKLELITTILGGFVCVLFGVGR